MTVWMHRRKGRIEGEVEAVSEDGVWTHITLTLDQRFKMLSVDDDGHRMKGDRITVRTAFLTEVQDDSVLS